MLARRRSGQPRRFGQLRRGTLGVPDQPEHRPAAGMGDGTQGLVGHLRDHDTSEITATPGSRSAPHGPEEPVLGGGIGRYRDRGADEPGRASTFGLLRQEHRHTGVDQLAVQCALLIGRRGEVPRVDQARPVPGRRGPRRGSRSSRQVRRSWLCCTAPAARAPTCGRTWAGTRSPTGRACRHTDSLRPDADHDARTSKAHHRSSIMPAQQGRASHASSKPVGKRQEQPFGAQPRSDAGRGRRLGPCTAAIRRR